MGVTPPSRPRRAIKGMAVRAMTHTCVICASHLPRTMSHERQIGRQQQRQCAPHFSSQIEPATIAGVSTSSSAKCCQVSNSKNSQLDSSNS